MKLTTRFNPLHWLYWFIFPHEGRLALTPNTVIEAEINFPIIGKRLHLRTCPFCHRDYQTYKKHSKDKHCHRWNCYKEAHKL